MTPVRLVPRDAHGPRLLVSVRDLDEALEAAAHGADIIDLKEPRSGALGAVPLATIRAVVARLRAAGHAQPVSATVGDWPAGEVEAIIDVAQAVAATGVDVVKVGIEGRAGPAGVHLLQRLAQALPQRVVPVLLADAGLDAAIVAQAATLPFAAAMLDTADKSRGSLFECIDDAGLRAFVQQLRGAGRVAGLAGSLRVEHVARVVALAPDIAGFRGAVTAAGRDTRLQPERVARLRRSLSEALEPTRGAAPVARA